MTRRATLWSLGVLGWVVSWVLFAKWLQANGGDFLGGWAEAFTASDFATGLLLDLVAVTFMMVALAVYDRKRLGPKWAAAVIASLALSVSMSLAIYLAAIWRGRAAERAAQVHD